MDTFWSIRMVFLFLGLACLCESGNGTPNATLEYSICNGETFSLQETLYVRKMEEVLDIAMKNVADNGYSFYARVLDETTDFQCWAHAACNGELNKLDCNACVIRAHDLLINHCERNIGAQFQLRDCRVRREKYQFKDD